MSLHFASFQAPPPYSPVRTLSAMERGFLSHSLFAQILFSMSLELGPGIDSARLSSAFNALRAAHRVLRVGIVDDSLRGLMFVDSERSLDVQFHDLPDDTSWPEAVSRDLSRWDRFDGERLFRATVLRGSAADHVVFTFNHAIADGRSALVLMNDFVQLLDGQEVLGCPTLPDVRSYVTDDAVPPADRTAPALPDFVRPAKVKTDGDAPVSVAVLELDATTTKRLVDLARAHGTTVQGVLAACAVCATADTRHEPLRLSSPVDVRGPLDAPTDIPGVFLALALNAIDQDDGEDFWALAARSVSTIAELKDRSAVHRLVYALETIVPAHADLVIAQEVLAPMTLDVMISNLGRVSLAGTSARTPVRAVWGPALNTQIAANDVIGVTTQGGQIRFVHTGSGARPHLLQAMHDVLIEQLGNLC